MIEFASEATVPVESWPPEPRKSFAATALQTLIIKRFVEKGFGEGVTRLHKRLRDSFKETIHPGLELEKSHDDPGNFRRHADGKQLLRETEDFDDELQFELNGIKYQIPRQATYDIVIDSTTQQPIPFRRNEPRFFPGQSFRLKHSGWKPRLLCPTLLQVQHHFALDPNVQIDRQPRNAVAGGIRAPPKNSIMPHLPPSILHTIYIDTMRMPAAQHDASVFSSSLEAGVAQTRRSTLSAPSRLVTYRWLFVAVDGFTKFCFVAPIAQRGSGPQAVEPKRPEDRPQSDQTFEAFQSFLARANGARHTRSLPEVHPTIITHDAGSEFKGDFAAGLQALRAQHDGKYREKVTPGGRSQFNSPAKRQVKTIRRYLFAKRNAFEHAVVNRGAGAGDNADKQQRRLKEQGYAYDWILDLPEIMRRYNTAYHSTIKCKPLEALLEILSPAIVSERIHKAAKKRFEGVRHEIRLPGFSPSSPPEVGDFVRLKTYKTGEMNASFPRLDGIKTGTKTASHNWSSDIFVVVEVKTVNYNLGEAKKRQEGLQKHVDESEDAGARLLDKAQRDLLNNRVQGARLYRVQNINPEKRVGQREGQGIKYYNSFVSD